VLNADAREVAAGIRRRAIAAQLNHKRIKADACAEYLTDKSDHLDYPTALAESRPIAGG